MIYVKSVSNEYSLGYISTSARIRSDWNISQTMFKLMYGENTVLEKLMDLGRLEDEI